MQLVEARLGRSMMGHHRLAHHGSVDDDELGGRVALSRESRTAREYEGRLAFRAAVFDSDGDSSNKRE